MRDRERILATFRGDNVDRVVWQPRLEHWYCVNQTRGTLPDEYQLGEIDKTAAESGFTPLMAEQLLGIYDDLDASIRYTERYPATGKGFLEFEMAGDIEVDIEENDDEVVRRLRTPRGNLREIVKKTELGCSKMNVEYLLESTDDIPVMEYVLRNREVSFNHDAYQNSKEFIDGRGVVQLILPRSPLQRTMLDYMGMERTLINLSREEERMNDFFETIERSDDRVYEEVKKSPVKVINFGENIDGSVTPPKYFEKYNMPYYRKRVGELEKADKFTHIHMDGRMEPLLPLLDDLPFDGIEAATPKPQGDVTVEELAEAMGDKVLLDGVPGISFLPNRPMGELKGITEKILEEFSPRLILGISDEPPPNSDFGRFKKVAKMANSRPLDVR